MPKLKDLLPNLFGTTHKEKASNGIGKLETDALPVGDDNTNSSQMQQQYNVTTPTASVELTESVVRELSDPNYNSMELVPSGDATAIDNSSALAMQQPTLVAPTMNTMNVHNAQQQVVMQFSNVNKLHFGSVYNFNNNTSASSSRKSSCVDDTPTMAACNTTDGTKRQTPRKTTSIVAMMQSQDEPNHRLLDTIATHLGEGWKKVMRDLGHSDGQIEQALIDHQIHGGIKEVIYQLLLQWLRNADDGAATLGHITTLLWESNHRDCVQRMKLVWKSESNANRKSCR